MAIFAGEGGSGDWFTLEGEKIPRIALPLCTVIVLRPIIANCQLQIKVQYLASFPFFSFLLIFS